MEEMLVDASVLDCKLNFHFLFYCCCCCHFDDNPTKRTTNSMKQQQHELWKIEGVLRVGTDVIATTTGKGM